MFVKAGSHQLGNDSHTIVQAAYDQGLLTDADIDGAAVKILEMTFKLGLFENPYVDRPPRPPPSARPRTCRTASTPRRRPSCCSRTPATTPRGARPAITAPATPTRPAAPPARPDVGEFASDTNGNGTVEVYFDGVDRRRWPAPTSTAPAPSSATTTTRAAGSGTAGTAGFTLPDRRGRHRRPTADIAVLRITARKGNYFGLDAGRAALVRQAVPGLQHRRRPRPRRSRTRNKVIDLFRVRDGYTDVDRHRGRRHQPDPQDRAGHAHGPAGHRQAVRQRPQDPRRDRRACRAATRSSPTRPTSTRRSSPPAPPRPRPAWRRPRGRVRRLRPRRARRPLQQEPHGRLDLRPGAAPHGDPRLRRGRRGAVRGPAGRQLGARPTRSATAATWPTTSRVR